MLHFFSLFYGSPNTKKQPQSCAADKPLQTFRLRSCLPDPNHFSMTRQKKIRDIEEKISSGKLDCGFLSSIEDDPLDFLPLLEDEILAIMPQRRTIGLATLPLKETTLLVRTFTAFCKSYSF